MPVGVLGAAMASGMRAEAAQAPSLGSSILHTIAAGGSPAIAPAGLPFSISAWVASTAMLAAIVLVSAGVPVWWGTTIEARTLPQADRPIPAGQARTDSAFPNMMAAPITADSKLTFLRQALEQLRNEPSSGEPTKLGLQLRKYMLGLTAEELEPVGKLLGEVPGYEGEFPAILGAFSTRVAKLNSPLALELLGSGKEKGDGKDGGIRFAGRHSWMCCHGGSICRRFCGFAARTKI